MPVINVLLFLWSVSLGVLFATSFLCRYRPKLCETSIICSSSVVGYDVHLPMLCTGLLDFDQTHYLIQFESIHFSFTGFLYLSEMLVIVKGYVKMLTYFFSLVFLIRLKSSSYSQT